MGSPGCGKSTTAAAVGHQLGLSVIDVDEYLENFWKTPVANKVYSYMSVISALVCLTTYCVQKGIYINLSFLF